MYFYVLAEVRPDVDEEGMIQRWIRGWVDRILIGVGALRNRNQRVWRVIRKKGTYLTVKTLVTYYVLTEAD